MTEKERILNAWIMVEHLSEGDIDPRKKSMLRFDDLGENDFHTFFLDILNKNKKDLKKNAGLIVYFDIFEFKEVINWLQTEYRLEKSEQDIKLGKKFGLSICFAKDLSFLKDMTFFTASQYIRKKKKLPDEKALQEYEEDLKEKIEQKFRDTEKDAEKFNAAMCALIKEHRFDLKNCRVQFLKNMESEVSNLHSFFIDDLEAAKKTDTGNFHRYLNGYTGTRVNLDSKKDSDHFNPDIFREILQPDHYPLGRFPSMTKFALSLMQQAAVNLSCGFDDSTIRSVNGPPGTGKTTLLKDIFAELVVQQAFAVASMSGRRIKGTEETIYFEKASIGELPDSIAQNNIVVASSNNGAVQNIVNELPLISGVDPSLVDALKEADYFWDLSNSTRSSKWEETDKGKREVFEAEPVQEEDKFWGLFSLEGGKSDNMNHVLTSIRLISKELEEEYEPGSTIYEEYIKQYQEVEHLRAQARTQAEDILSCEEDRRKLSDMEQAFPEKRKKREEDRIKLEPMLQDACNKIRSELAPLQEELRQISARKKELSANRAQLQSVLETLRQQKIGMFAGKKIRQEHQNQVSEAGSRLMKAVEEEDRYSAMEQKLLKETRAKKQKLEETQSRLQGLDQELQEWIRSSEKKIEDLKRQIKKKEQNLKQGITALDMNLPYDQLQLSNPWFTEEYRIAQSRLFIASLKVRKQFLYENLKNIKAACNIWSRQNEYLDRKRLIQAAWNWINFTIPVISSTFASFGRMCKNIGPDTLGHLFIDEAGQALPQAGAGAIIRSRHVMVVGDPSQIKPVLTLDMYVLRLLRNHFGVSEAYLHESASVQTLVDAAGKYGFYRDKDLSEESWIGIPLWVHRRCKDPMFTISNRISYNDMMVQAAGEKDRYGKTGWFDVPGKANDKYVQEQADFLRTKIQRMMEQDPEIADRSRKDKIYVITPFTNVAYRLSMELKKIGFTRYDENGKPANIGTIHTFQGKEAPIVFMVLGADGQSKGAAGWAVSEPNMMNVAATRAKKEFYVVGDKKLYRNLGSSVADDTISIISKYGKDHPELVDEDCRVAAARKPEAVDAQMEAVSAGKPEVVNVQAGAVFAGKPEVVNTQTGAAEVKKTQAAVPHAGAGSGRVTGTVNYVGRGKTANYAYITGSGNTRYTITEKVYAATQNADQVIQKGKQISFEVYTYNGRSYAKQVQPN